MKKVGIISPKEIETKIEQNISEIKPNENIEENKVEENKNEKTAELKKNDENLAEPKKGTEDKIINKEKDIPIIEEN